MKLKGMEPQKHGLGHYFRMLILHLDRQGAWWTACYYVHRIHMLLFSLVRFHRKDISIDPSAYIVGTKYMCIGQRFHAGRGLWLEAVESYYEWRFTPKLVIGNNVALSDYVHIGCVNRVTIGNNVLMGSKIYITDHNHGVYSGAHQDSPDVPPGLRHLTEGKAVTIEDNVWIGEFCTILPGVTIGYGSIIGSHTTVTHDIPPESIAVGSPAKVIKRWNAATQMWDKVEKK